jgi:hypothetical protein
VRARSPLREAHNTHREARSRDQRGSRTLSERLAALIGRLAALIGRLTALIERLAALNRRLAVVGGRLCSVVGRLAAVGGCLVSRRVVWGDGVRAMGWGDEVNEGCTCS